MLVRFERYPVSRPRFGDVLDMEREVTNMFDNLLSVPGTRWSGASPSVDIAEYENETVVVAEIPGVAREDVKLTLQEGMLTISGERKQAAVPEKGAVVRSELAYGSFRRTFELPHPVQADAVTAELTNGVLRVTLPKAEQARPRDIRVK
jgi:HSP20 family protein